METLAFLTLLLLITSGSAVEQTLRSHVTGYVGQDVLLSFNCSNDPNELSWQKGSRVVNAHSKDPINIDHSYVNRTHLFINKENRNCSLLLHNLSTADAGLYSSYAIVSLGDNVWSSMLSEVNLTVSEMEGNSDQVSETKDNSATAVSVPILVVMLILAVSLLLTILVKRYHRRNMETDLPAAKPMLQFV
ncbi:uncharacterized protein si:dkey-192g7.3 [Puntigrus tetrazona]|uniref:uncharacterized protein si:dkey-192g7.3 n=1 Tax=Puntigrus tetrazona TaxID=1606681 RepID=UPI001C8AD192|nr:uncharacterized protein si:dkey-192g7.3 [Puntigrus tetrazona]